MAASVKTDTCEEANAESADRPTGQGGESRRRAKPAVITDALLCAAASVVAFAYAFAYEAGFADHFSIPLELVRVDTATVIIAVLSVLGVGICLYVVLDWIYAFWRSVPASNSPYRRLAIELVPLALVLLAKVILFGERWRYWLWWLAYVATWIAITVVNALIVHRSKPTLRDKMRAAQELDDQVETLSSVAVPALIQRVGKGGSLLIGLALFGLLLSNDMGTSVALRRADWPVIPGPPEMVVLRVYGDTMICAAFDSSGRVGQDLALIRMADNYQTRLRVRHIGPLRAREPNEKGQKRH